MGQRLVCKFQRFYEEMDLDFSVYSAKSFWCPFLRLLCQVTCKKAEMKKCVIRITAIDVRKGSKNTSFLKKSRSPALRLVQTIYNHSFNKNSFLQAFKRLESSTPNISSAVRMNGIICSKIFLSCFNSCHHLFENFSCAVQIFTASIRNFVATVQMVFETDGTSTCISHLFVSHLL